MRELPCESCGGARLAPAGRSVTVGRTSLPELSALSIGEAHTWITQLPEILDAHQNEVAEEVIKEIRERLGFMLNVGLHYLTLARRAGTLSGGEGQRIRLASQIGSGLMGVLYILDETIHRTARPRQRSLDSNLGAPPRYGEHRDGRRTR